MPEPETREVTIDGVVYPVKICYFNDPDGTPYRLKYVDTGKPEDIIFLGRWFGPQIASLQQ